MTEADAGESLAKKKRTLNEQLVRVVGASIARSFGAFLALNASLVHSEIRDGSNLCFHDHDREAYRAFSGRAIPVLATHKGGVRYGKIAAFSRDRIVADDDEILAYYRWFWQRGDGWNNLHSNVHEGLKSTKRDDLWTFFDPAVRAPSVWGSRLCVALDLFLSGPVKNRPGCRRALCYGRGSAGSAGYEDDADHLVSQSDGARITCGRSRAYGMGKGTAGSALYHDCTGPFARSVLG
ncbi:MAG: hypothetical protein ACKVJG_24460 [Candidatus Latescibacterota bacterium]